MLKSLNHQVITCTKCPRLSQYTREVADKKVRRFMDWDYWGKPVPGFGDPDARALIIGLAPAAHGANRTGRMFTGDSSGDWLYKALYETGFASKPESYHIDDGMKLKDIYITAIGRCAPPQNKPTIEEIENCSPYLEREIEILRSVKIILCLGGLSFNRFCKLRQLKGLKFKHLAAYTLDDGRILMSSFHPSRQNTNTGKLTWSAWMEVFVTVRQLL